MIVYMRTSLSLFGALFADLNSYHLVSLANDHSNDILSKRAAYQSFVRPLFSIALIWSY
jgi:hypothetical protein